MSVRKVFDKEAEKYDKSRKQLIPCFDEFYSAAISLISFNPAEKIKVLDLGAGTGLFSHMVMEFFPNAEFILCDISEKMLEVARERFEGKEEIVKFQVLNYSADTVEGEYDLVISALSIHHLDENEKKNLFPKIFAVLKEGGLFINADQVLGETPFIEDKYRKTWLRQVREAKVSEKTLSDAFERMKEDKMSTLENQLNYLKEAGFSNVHNWYQNFSFVVYSGIKE